jgi:hypothetical protein
MHASKKSTLSPVKDPEISCTVAGATALQSANTSRIPGGLSPGPISNVPVSEGESCVLIAWENWCAKLTALEGGIMDNTQRDRLAISSGNTLHESQDCRTL